MKRYNKYLIALVAGGLFLNSCSKDFVEVKPRGTALEDNYYRNADEAFNGLVAAYDPLGTECGATYSNKLGPLNSASDDCYAGGGNSTDVPAWQAWNNYTVDPSVGIQADFWDRNFTGVYRANVLLSKLDGVPMDAALKARFIAESKFLRAYFYFDLVRLFKNVPLFISPVLPDDMFNVTQAKPEDVWAQIEKDLNDAIPDLPIAVPVGENGRVTQLAAIALLGKVILYQNNDSRMIEAADLFEQVNTSPNYELLSDYGQIFRADNKFNKESIFEIVHTAKGISGWDAWPNFEGNVYTQMVGPRAYVGNTYVAGWGFNPITPELISFMKDDPRYTQTVYNVDDLILTGEANSYEKGYQNTGYFAKKFAPLKEFYNLEQQGDPVLNYPNNVIEIRLADTYLMEAEALLRGSGSAAKAQYYLDQVRTRAGLPSIPATLDNIYNERRLELATEGHRWFDLVRSGKAGTALASKGYTVGKNEILPIPLAELANTKLIQNPKY